MENYNYNKVVKKLVSNPTVYVKTKIENVAKRIVSAYKKEGKDRDTIEYITNTLDLMEIEAELEEWDEVFGRISDLESKLNEKEYKSLLNNQRKMKEELKYLLNKRIKV